MALGDIAMSSWVLIYVLFNGSTTTGQVGGFSSEQSCSESGYQLKAQMDYLRAEFVCMEVK